MEQYLKVSEVADLLQISQNTIYRAIKSGSLRAAKFGTVWRVSPADLQRWIEISSSAGAA